MKIDAHNHLGGPDRGDGRSQSPDEIIAAMDSAGVDMAVVFPFNEAEPGVSFSRANDYIAKAVHERPDRLIGFCRLDPNYGSLAIAELVRSVAELGLSGIKLHPTSQGFPLDNKILIDILAVAEDMGVTVAFDTGKTLSPPSMVASLALRFPRLNIIMAHMNLFEESISAAEAAPNIYIGTTGYFNPRRLSEAVRRVGAGRFIAGSDSPYIKIGREVEKITALIGPTDAEKRLILGDNAASVLKVGST